MGATMYITLSNTLPHMQPCLARGDANIQTYSRKNANERRKNANGDRMQTDRLESMTSCNLSFDTMLSHQLSPMLKLLENGHNNVYQARAEA